MNDFSLPSKNATFTVPLSCPWPISRAFSEGLEVAADDGTWRATFTAESAVVNKEEGNLVMTGTCEWMVQVRKLRSRCLREAQPCKRCLKSIEKLAAKALGAKQ